MGFINEILNIRSIRPDWREIRLDTGYRIIQKIWQDQISGASLQLDQHLHIFACRFIFISHTPIRDNLECAQIGLSDQLAPTNHESEFRFAAHMKLFPLNGFDGFLMEVVDN